jgi:mono/diheme cytochrome c family protein
MRRIGLAGAVAALALNAGVVGSSCGGERPDGGDAKAAGQQVFEGRCSSCHGVDLNGTDTAPALRSEAPGGREPEAITVRDAVRRGVEPTSGYMGMPAVPGISDAELDDLVAYLDAVRASG